MLRPAWRGWPSSYFAGPPAWQRSTLLLGLLGRGDGGSWWICCWEIIYSWRDRFSLEANSGGILWNFDMRYCKFLNVFKLINILLCMRWLSWRHTVDSQYPFDPARLGMPHILVPRSQSAWQVGAGKVKGRAYMVRLGKTRQHAGCPFWFIWFLSMHSSFCRICRDTVTMWRPCAGPWQWFPMFSSARSSNIARICQDWEFDVTFPCSHGIKCACHIPRMLLCHNFFGQYLSLVSWLRSNSE